MNSPYNGKFKVSQQFKGTAHDGLDLVGIDSKEVHSTVNGTVEKAGWENANNKAQGFGLYVRIKKQNSVDKYYYGHLSEVKVKTGQKVKIGDVIGIEGSTGNSTGSHCHYCARGNGLKTQIRDICEISGIPNKLGVYDGGQPENKKEEKSISQLAREVLEGKWGNGTERKEKLTKAGYDYNLVQNEVNKLLKPKAPLKKTTAQIADEVIKGLWGNGKERKDKLTKAGYNYSAIQRAVNKKLKEGKK